MKHRLYGSPAPSPPPSPSSTLNAQTLAALWFSDVPAARFRLNWWGTGRVCYLNEALI